MKNVLTIAWPRRAGIKELLDDNVRGFICVLTSRYRIKMENCAPFHVVTCVEMNEDGMQSHPMSPSLNPCRVKMHVTVNPENDAIGSPHSTFQAWHCQELIRSHQPPRHIPYPSNDVVITEPCAAGRAGASTVLLHGRIRTEVLL